MLTRITTTLLTISTLLLPLANTQFVSSLPQCIQNCIAQSQDTNCQITDIKCLCRASAGNFLTDTITCMHGNCDNDLDSDLLLTPLQLVCQIAGTPIPESAIRNAENQASSLATQVTTTVTSTMGMGSSYASTVTITTTESGRTVVEIWPVTVRSGSTATGPASTVTVAGVSVSTLTMTNSRGITVTMSPSTITTSASSTSVASNTDTTTTTSVAAQQTISSTTGSKTSKASNPDATDSAPFKNTNGSPGKARLGSILLGSGVIWLVLLVVL